jgi:C-terminal processing protease CtpA/Prc
VGDTTGGGSAIPILRELPNGWILRISNSQLMLPSGTDFQNTGLYPQFPIWITSQDAENGIDTILEKAISILTNN